MVGREQRHPRPDLVAVERSNGAPPRAIASAYALAAAPLDHHEALVAEQLPTPSSRSQAQPPLARLQRERAQPRVGVRDPEDPRQARRLARADALGLEHRHPRAAALQLVRGRQPADPGAHDHDVHRRGIVGLRAVADLQEIVDDLEAEIRRPISVEDRRWRLLAHSAQPDEADAVRRSSILTRETSPDVAAWLEGLGLQRARDLVDVPRNDDLGMTRRGCLPIRHGDVLLGFLWVIVGDRPLSDAERAGLARGGEEVAANLWGRQRAADERRRRTLEQLDALLAGARAPPRELAATAALAGDRGATRSRSATATRLSPSGCAAAARRRLRLVRRRAARDRRPRSAGAAHLPRSLRAGADTAASARRSRGSPTRPSALRQAEIAALVRAHARRSGRSPPTTSSAAGR